MLADDIEGQGTTNRGNDEDGEWTLLCMEASEFKIIICCRVARGRVNGSMQQFHYLERFNSGFDISSCRWMVIIGVIIMCTVATY